MQGMHLGKSNGKTHYKKESRSSSVKTILDVTEEENDLGISTNKSTRVIHATNKANPLLGLVK